MSRDYTVRVLTPEETDRIERKVLDRLEGTDPIPRHDPGDPLVELIVAADLCATVRHLRAQREELLDVLHGLIQWDDHMGGWVAPAWDRARKLADNLEDNDR